MVALLDVIGPAVAITSGLLLIAFGIWLRGIGARGRAALAFTALAVLWGAQVVTANVARVWTDPSAGRAVWWVFAVLVTLLYVPVLVLVRSYPVRRGRLGRGTLPIILLCLPGLVVLLAVVVDPSVYLRSFFVIAPARTGAAFGPLFVPVLVANTVLAFAFALFVVHRALRKAGGGVVQQQLRVLELGLLPYVGYRGAQVIMTEIVGATGFTSAGGALLKALVVTMGVAAFTCALWVLVDAVRHRRDRWQLAAVALGSTAVVVGFAEPALRQGEGILLDTVGLWRLVTVATFAYGIAHFRVHDLEERVAGALPYAAFGFASVVGLEVLIDVLGPSVNDRPLEAVVVTLLFEAALLTLPHWLHRRWPTIAARLRGGPQADRRLQVYLAAVEAALVDGVVTSREDGILKALRAQLQIDDAEHGRIMQQASFAPTPGMAAP